MTKCFLCRFSSVSKLYQSLPTITINPTRLEAHPETAITGNAILSRDLPRPKSINSKAIGTNIWPRDIVVARLLEFTWNRAAQFAKSTSIGNRAEIVSNPESFVRREWTLRSPSKGVAWLHFRQESRAWQWQASAWIFPSPAWFGRGVLHPQSSASSATAVGSRSFRWVADAA